MIDPLLRRRGAALPATLLVLLVSSPLSLAAQAPRWEASLSGSRIQYDSLAALNAPAASGLLEWRRPALFGRLTSGVTGFQNAGWTLQGSGDLSGRFSPAGPSAPIHLELAAHGSGSRHSSGSDALLARGDARIHATSGALGGWLGAGTAYARSSFDSATVRTVVPNVGVWGRRGPLQMTLAYQRPMLPDRSYDEVTGSLGYMSSHVDFTAVAGSREAASGAATERDTWLGASAAVWVRANAAIVISAGRYAPDVIQGLPGGDYFSVGFRLTRDRPRAIPEAALRTPLVYSASEATSGGISFEVEGARTIEIAGDWNGWSPERLTRDASGRWMMASSLAPGIYRFNLRIDGERWVVPEGFPSADDGFGGEVGLLIISERP